MREQERSKTRPTTEPDATEWEALGIVYLSNPQPTSAEIGAAVAQYGKLIRGHSQEFSKLKVRLKNASGADEMALREQISKKLEAIHRAVTAANTWGDPQVVANLGGNQKLISDFVSCLIYANNTGDHNGQIPKDVLRLLAQVTTIDREFLMDSLQFAKISKKFESKGDSEVKNFVKTIKENAKNKDDNSKATGDGIENVSISDTAAALKTSGTTDSKAAAGADSAAKKSISTTIARGPSSTLPNKRVREDDTEGKPGKRIASDSANPQTSQTVTKTAPSKVVVSAPNATGTKLFGSGMLGRPTKPPPKTAPKVTSVKSEVAKTEAANTKMDARKEAIQPVKYDLLKAKKKDPIKMEASTASKLGGIGALLDEISNSKPKPTGRSTPEREARIDRDETPEEKARRLRKEKRRHLRVSWKEGEALTEVRLFHKDVAEDEGRASNMIRDAHDDRSEGMQFKKANQAQFEEDDDDEPADESEWSMPTGIDFSVIPQNQRSKASVTRGGLKDFESQQQKLLAEREKTELMVIYTDPIDIPPSPKSPHPSPQEDTEMQTGQIYDMVQDDPKLAEIHLRWAEAGSRGLSWARLSAVRRAQKGQPASLPDAANMPSSAKSPVHSTSSTTPARPLTRDEQVLTLLTSDRVRNYKDPSPYDPANPQTQRRYDYIYPELQKAADVVENLVELMKGKPYPPTEPPEWMKNDSARTAEWWQGYNKDKQRAEQRTQHAQQQVSRAAQVAPVPQQHEIPAVQPTQTAAVDPNAAAWMAWAAQMQQHGQGQSQAQQNAYTQAYAAFYGAQTAAQPQQPAAASQDSNANLQATLAALSAMTATPNQQQQPVAQQQNSSDPELQALLASLAQTQQHPTQAYNAAQAQGAQAQFQQMPADNDPNMLAYIMALAGQGQQSGAQPQQAQFQQQQQQRDDSRERERSGGRKREREDDGGMHPSRREKNSRGNKGNRNSDKENNNIPPHLRGINREKIGTKPCTFWAKGQCQKGEQCTFRHD